MSRWGNQDIWGRQKERYFGEEKKESQILANTLKDIPADSYLFIIILVYFFVANSIVEEVYRIYIAEKWKRVCTSNDEILSWHRFHPLEEIVGDDE